MGLLRWSNESIKLLLTEGLKVQTVLASEDWMMSWFCDPLLILCCSCMCLSGTLHSQLFPQVARHRGNITSLIHRNELCALCLSLFLFLSLCHHWVLPFFVSAFSMSLNGQFTQIKNCSSFGFVLGLQPISRRQIKFQVKPKLYALEICFFLLLIWDDPPKENESLSHFSKCPNTTYVELQRLVD